MDTHGAALFWDYRVLPRATLPAELAQSFPPSPTPATKPALSPSERKAQHRLRVDLRKAVANCEFELEYQPIFDSLSGGITAFEALLRWNRPLLGRISPAVFIPVAEQNSLMPQLGAWVVQQACRECAKWPSHIKVSVNMSASQLADPAVERVVSSALSAAGLRPERLQLELTETFLLADQQALLSLSRLHASGAAIALDDFGTGYSSLSYLHNFPFDKIKIDKGFVQQKDECRHSYRMLEALMRFASVLEIPTVIEGVETAQQLQTVKSFGPCEIQGYLLGKPMSAAKVAALVEGLC